MAGRHFIDILPDGTLRPVDADSAGQLGARNGRFWLHDSHPEIVFLTFAGLDTPSMPEPEPRAILTADIGVLSPIDVFGMIAQNRLTLRVIAVRSGVERVLLFREGEVASIASNHSHDRIGGFLVRLGLVDRHRLEDALAQESTSHRRAGQILVESGAISAHDLWRAIQQQITDVFCDVATWQSGHIVCYTVAAKQGFPTNPTIGSQGLMLEAMRRADEMSLIRNRIPDDRVRVVATGGDHELNDIERELWRHASEPTSIEEIRRALHGTSFDLLKTAFGLVQAGSLRIVTAAPGEAPRRQTNARSSDVVQVFNLALGEILEEVRRAGASAQFSGHLDAYLADPRGLHAQLYTGIRLATGQELPADSLLQNAHALSPDNPGQLLSEALNELLFFALFQCGELLDTAVDENLARRVRLIYSTLEGG